MDYLAQAKAAGLTGISIYSLENIKDQIKRVKEKMREDGDTYGINN